jgi:hypothetical protein
MRTASTIKELSATMTTRLRAVGSRDTEDSNIALVISLSAS